MAAPSSPEFNLLVACASWPPSTRRVEAVRAAAGARIDWQRFVRVVARHRMAGMAVNGLTAASVTPSADADRSLRDRARADLLQAFAILAEGARLVALLHAAGIAVTVLKGPPLAATIYGTLSVRQLHDLDLLIEPEAMARALELLMTDSYVPCLEGGDQALRPDHSAVRKDVVLVHRERRVIVELHARLNDNADLLPVAAIGAAGAIPVGGGVTMPALSGEPLLIYLIVHGFRHGWSRLKWLVDVAVLVGAMSEAELAGLLAAMRTRGLEVVGHSTMLVLKDVIGLDLPTAIERTARRSWRARWCASMAARYLHHEREPDGHLMLSIAMAGTLMLISPTHGYRRQEVARLLIDYPMAVRFGGGRRAIALSILLRPFVWSGRKLFYRARTSMNNADASHP